VTFGSGPKEVLAAVSLHDLNDFLRLSEVLNLQLCIKAGGWDNIAAVILYKKSLPKRDREVMNQVLTYLETAYGQRKRKLGPLSVLHPLRATALLARAAAEVNPLDLETCLLHDKLEDITPQSIGKDRYDELEASFQRLLKTVDPLDQWFLMERLDWMTRRPGATYFQYIGNLLDHAARTPELIRIKLADRLDNTLDMHVDISDPIAGVDFFEVVFQRLYVRTYPGHHSDGGHPPPSPLNGSERLYQLFKSAIVMSLVRQRGVGKTDPTCGVLFEALARASMKESQRILLHIFDFHLNDAERQQALLMEVLRYAQAGSIDKVTLPQAGHRLDGLLFTCFQDPDQQTRMANLARLYADKELMVQAALAFVIIFQSFLNDPSYYVVGISEQGICPP
jgi:hypothetical protein